MPAPTHQPAPYLLPKRPGVADQGLCITTRKAIAAFLADGEEPGPENRYIVYDIIIPYLRNFLKQTKTAREAAVRAEQAGELGVRPDPFNPDNWTPHWTREVAEAEKMVEKAEFYLEIAHSVREDSFEQQRKVLWEFVVAPMFYGSGFEIYFDDESPWVKRPSDYCWPQRFLSRLDYTLNAYADLTNAWDSIQELQVEWLETNIGTWEEIQRAHKEHIEPVIDFAKDAAEESAQLLHTVGSATLKGAKYLPVLLLAGVGLWAYTQRSKR